MNKQIYSIDVRVYATAYIRAGSAEEAAKIARELKDTNGSLMVRNKWKGDGEIEISELEYDDPELPDVSLSPAMTIVGPDEGTEVYEAGT